MMALGSAAQAEYKPAFTTVQKLTHFHVYFNGSTSQTMESAIRIETELGVRLHSERGIYYNSTYETVDVIEAYTLQPDGIKVHLEADKIRTQDESADGSKVLTDEKVKLMIYPKVQVGSVLYYKIKSHQHTPNFPNHFAWSETYSPFYGHENVEIVITHDPAIALRFAHRGMQGGGEALQPSDIPGSIRHRYTYRQTNFVPTESGVVALDDFAPQFSVSSFKNYAEVAQAYQSRAKPKTEMTPAIEALARSLTHTDQTTEQKSRRLYNWVSKNIRYLGVYVGAGGYVPHSAQSILDNRYGDCKDHVVLLEALLRAVGIESSPVLINAGNSHRLPDLATPYAFNHVITFIPELNLYLDTTAEFAPFGMLPEAVMQQPALITATGNVSETPAVNSHHQYSETHTRFDLQNDGSIIGTSVTQTFGHLQVRSRATQSRQKDKDPNAVVNLLLNRYLESGSGKMTVPDPKDLDAPWVITSSFVLAPMINLPGPSALVIPVGLAPGNIKGISMAPANLNRKFPETCITTRLVEHATLVIPRGITIRAIPQNVNFKLGEVHYSAHYKRISNSVNVRRELYVQRTKRFCQPNNEKEWQALTDVMKRDLRGQVLLR